MRNSALNSYEKSDFPSWPTVLSEGKSHFQKAEKTIVLPFLQILSFIESLAISSADWSSFPELLWKSASGRDIIYAITVQMKAKHIITGFKVINS